MTGDLSASTVVIGLSNKHPLTQTQVGELLIGELRPLLSSSKSGVSPWGHNEFASQRAKFPMLFATRTMYKYSNTNYMLLALIIQRVSNKSVLRGI